VALYCAIKCVCNCIRIQSKARYVEKTGHFFYITKYVKFVFAQILGK
jgi:hypothetical protein